MPYPLYDAYGNWLSLFDVLFLRLDQGWGIMDAIKAALTQLASVAYWSNPPDYRT